MIDVLSDPMIIAVFYCGIIVLAFILLWHWVVD